MCDDWLRAKNEGFGFPTRMTKVLNLSGATQLLPSQPLTLRKFGSQLRYQRAYYHGFVVALLLCWSPSNSLAYLSPALMVAYYLFVTRNGVILRNLTLLVSFWYLWMIAHLPFVHNFAWGSALFSLFTFSAFIPLLIIPTRFLSGEWLMPRLQRWVRVIILLQASLGIVQAYYGFRRTGSFDLGNGDFVEGTIHPWLMAEASFSNPMFAVNMTFLLLFLLPSLLTERKHLFVILLGIFVLILASVVHVLLFLGVATALVFLLYAPVLLRRRSGLLFMSVAAIAVVTALSLLSTNFSGVGRIFGWTTNAMTPRGMMFQSMVTQVIPKYPYMSLFGFGQGQFSSRASLIGTGYYYGNFETPRPLPLMSEQFSEPFERYALPIWSAMYDRAGFWGSTHQPFFSWLTLYTEFGLVVCLFLLLLVCYLLMHIRGRARTYGEQAMAIALSIGILFVVLLGFQENYWEVPQAIFPGLLILQVMYARFHEVTSPRHPTIEREQLLGHQGLHEDASTERNISL
jgi:hypothetical protein